MKIRTRLFLTVIGLALVLLVSNIISYDKAQDILINQIISHLNSIASLQKKHLSSVVRQSYERLRLVSSRTQLRISLKKFLDDGSKSHLIKMQKILKDARDASPVIMNIDVLSLDGVVRASSVNSRTGELSPYSDQECFSVGMIKEHISGIEYSSTNSEGYFNISGPLYLNGELLGVIIIRSSLEEIVSSIRDYSGLGNTGETVLAARQTNGNVKFLISKRFEAKSQYDKIVSPLTHDLPIILSFESNINFITNAKDYRGISVIAVTHYIENPGWGIVVKIDKEEAFAPLKKLRHTLIYIVLGCIFIVFLGAVYLNKFITDPISRLTDAARDIAEGNDVNLVVSSSKDEIGVLTRTFNTMTEKLTTLNDELLESQEEWERTFEAIGDAALILDKEQIITKANKIAHRVVSLEGESLIGKHCFAVFRHADSSCEDCPVLISADTKKVYTGEIEHKSLGKTFEATSSPILDDGDQVIGFVYFMRDITRQKNLEEQLRQSQKMEAVGTLAGGIAHDFNNILSPILGYADLALEAVDVESQTHKDIKEIIYAGLRAKDLVKQILNFSSHSKLERHPLKIQIIVKEALKLLRSTIPVTIEIKQDIDEKCAPVWADPTEIHQIIVNLCTNSYHAMKQNKKGVLDISLVQVDLKEIQNELPLPSGAYILITVSDNGKGMDENILSQIFDPFFTTKEKGKGTGLGLYVIHGIVLMLKGYISVSSVPGEGSTFKVYLPVTQRREVDNVKVKTDPLPRGKEHVLVVDDLPELALMNKRILENLGYQVTSFTDSVKALEAFKKNPDVYDLILSDITMPRLTGDKLARLIIEIRPGIPIILCTGFSDLLNEKEAKTIGIGDIIQKPISQYKLACAVRNLLDAGADERL